MKKRLRGININISNRAFYSIILLAISILVVAGVFAFGTTTPSAFGHSAKELDLSGGVNGNAVFLGNVGIGVSNPTARLDVSGELKIGNTGVACDTSRKGFLRSNSADGKLEFCDGTSWGQLAGTATSSGGTYTGALVSGTKTGSDCSNAGGVPTNIGGSTYVCKFISSTCATGWTQYLKWSTTLSATCTGTSASGGNSACPATTCQTSSHVFSNKTQETCTYYNSIWTGDGSDTCSIDYNIPRTCTAGIQEIGCY